MDSASYNRHTRNTSELFQSPLGSSVNDLGGLTKTESVKGYHGTAYGGELNQKLRNRESLFANDLSIIGTMDAKMQPTKSPMILDREVNDGYLKALGLDTSNISCLVGQRFRDDGYVSTTYQPNQAKHSTYSFYGGDPIFLLVNVPEGTPAMLTDNDEFEITLGRGLTYEIVSASVDTTGVPLLGVDIIK